MHPASPYFIFSCILLASSVFGFVYTFTRPEFVVTDSTGHSYLTSSYGNIILEVGFTLVTVVSLFLVVVYFREVFCIVREDIEYAQPDGPIYVIMTPEEESGSLVNLTQPPPTYVAYV